VRLTIAGVALIAVTYGLARFALGLFVPELRDAFGLSSSAVGWMLSASFAGYLVALVAAGSLLRRVGARATALLSGTCAVVGTAGIALASTATLTAVAAVVGGASTGWSSTALASAVQDQLRRDRQASAQTTINAGTSIGLLVAAAAATVAADAWRLAWLLFAGLALIATVGVTHTVTVSHRPVVAGRTGPLLEPIGRRLAATAAVLGASSATVWTFGREQFVVAAGLPPGTGQITWVALGLGGIAGAAAGTAARRFGLAPTVATVWLAYASAHLLLATVPASTTSAFAMTATIGAGYMAMTGLVIVWAVRDRPDQPGAAVATAFLVLAAGQTVASPVAGLVADHLDLAAPFIVAAAIAAGGLAALPTTTRPRSDHVVHAAVPPVHERAGHDPLGCPGSR